jgi:hypothetical protein
MLPGKMLRFSYHLSGTLRPLILEPVDHPSSFFDRQERSSIGEVMEDEESRERHQDGCYPLEDETKCVSFS